jgi:hypothetical protein
MRREVADKLDTAEDGIVDGSNKEGRLSMWEPRLKRSSGHKGPSHIKK